MTATFIKAAELWIPSHDGSLLEFGGGAFGTARRFAAISRELCFGRGEGLPGRAWEERRPILLPQFEGSFFRRNAAAKAAGFTCAIALPTFVDDRLISVLVIFCGHEAKGRGALELWRDDAAGRGEMTLVDGAFGQAQTFETISRQTQLQRGAGLPGQAWLSGHAVFLDDLPASPGRFVRTRQAAAAGLQRGLAIPFASQQGERHVVTFLAAADLPLAGRIEQWTLDEPEARLRRVFAFSELHGGASRIEATLPLSTPSGSIVKAWTRGTPVINDWPADESGAPAAAAASIGAWALLAIPVMSKGSVVEVVALYL
ncbi:GAF domain-containing protein [Variovorax sp. YR216]|uniref:GAF domain-containing protein n=1 Tax=Variovorax sp. YR216 TaxID=1882828 RepID=UPI000895AE22|nr:GAF domain-containing protein [Variovorax sp. YR216]SEB20210.1 hypothetical protein SAMN05444680_11382 [Variovorax sp. YR216]